jgi:hypothetical protein
MTRKASAADCLQARPQPAGHDPIRFCLGCDNRHGCRSAQAICLELERAPDEAAMPGRQFMRRRGLLAACAGCALLRRCWSDDDYRRALAECLAGPKKPGASSK